MASSRFAAYSSQALGVSLAACISTYGYEHYRSSDTFRIVQSRCRCEEDRSAAAASSSQPRINKRHEQHPQATPTTEVTRLSDAHDASYPNFSRYGSHCLLKQYLTSAVWHQLRNKRTCNGVTLEHVIAAGVTLPFGANPPRGLAGVYAGDAESYTVFAPLLLPLIEQHHKPVWKPKLQRHRTDMSPRHLVQDKIDPTGQYILFTRMRLARSIQGFDFAPCITRSQRRRLERLIRDCVNDWKVGQYMSVMDMSNEQHDELIARQLLFPDPDDFALAAGLGRDWPDGRGVYCDSSLDDPSLPDHSIVLWVNAPEDHVWLQSIAKGGDVQKVFTRLSKSMMALETSLADRGYTFVQDRKLGFLNTSPANIGTALRASVSVKLVRLGQRPGFADLVKRLRLEAHAEYEGAADDTKRYTGIFSIANAVTLGKSELQLANIMIRGVGQLIELEKKLETGQDVDLSQVAPITVATTKDTEQT